MATRGRRPEDPILTYRAALTEAMNELAQDERTVFLGQAVACKGTYMSATFEGVPQDKLIELPVAEEMQAGMCIGMALDGYIPICIYPRYNFALLAMNQLVNHLDKMQPHVIVRVGIGSTRPLDPGPQHRGDMTEAFRLLMPNTNIVRINDAADAGPAYVEALSSTGPSILVEQADRYEDPSA